MPVNTGQLEFSDHSFYACKGTTTSARNSQQKLNNNRAGSDGKAVLMDKLIRMNLSCIFEERSRRKKLEELNCFQQPLSVAGATTRVRAQRGVVHL